MSALGSERWFIDPPGTEPRELMISSLLAATDFSEEAQHAVDRVGYLARELNATATLVHIDKSRPNSEQEGTLAPSERSPTLPGHLELELAASELAAAHEIDVRAETRRGDVCDQLFLMANAVDMIAVSAKQRHPLHRMVFGSIAGRLLDRCRKPVLVVKRAPQGPYRRVLVLTDFSERSIAAAELAACIAPEAELHLFHAIDLRGETDMRFAEIPDSVIRMHRLKRKAAAQIEMDRTLASLGLPSSRFAHAFGHGSVVPLALLKQRALDSDLLVVAKRFRPVTRSFILWSNARRLSDECPCDVLVVPTIDRDFESRPSGLATAISDTPTRPEWDSAAVAALGSNVGASGDTLGFRPGGTARAKK
jgi:nucleotide-binding universal stress UspA family protein